MTTIRKADALRAQCRFGEAAEAYAVLLKSKYTLEAAMGLGHSLRMMGTFGRAKAAYQRVLGKEKDPLVKADALVGKALCLKALVDHGPALTLIGKAGTVYRRAHDEAGTAYALWARATILRVSCDFPAALEAAEEALGMYDYYGDDEGLTYANCAIGGLKRILGDFDGSGEHYGDALKLAEKRRDLFAVSYAHCGLGNVHRMKGEFAKALKRFAAAEKGYAEIGDIVSFSYTLWSMGMTKLFLKDFKTAERKFRLALGNFETTGDRRGSAYAYLGLAQLNMLKGESALDELKQARRLTGDLGIGWEALMVRLVESHDKPRSMAALNRHLDAFGSAWRPEGFPVNIP